MAQDTPPWSYGARAAELLGIAASALDLGTGGGERLLEWREHWPAHVTATEEYPPNLRLATERLAQLGVRVIEARLTEVDPLPLQSGDFHVVLNRHSAFNSAEVARVLRPGGTFLTQQVHGQTLADLQAAFDARPLWPDASPERYVPRLEAAGLRVADRREWSGIVSFSDVGALVYYLKAVPWTVPGFSVDSHLEHLQRLQAQLDRGEPLRFTMRNYLLEARLS